MELDRNTILYIRELLYRLALALSDIERIKFNADKELVEAILFDKEKDGEKRIAYCFKNVLNKFDFTGISFDNVDITSTDFTGSKGVKINPQTILNKFFYNTKLCDTEIEGSFDDVIVYHYTDFTGSKGAKINPQTLGRKDLVGIKLCDTEIIGSFAGVDIRNTDFTGSKGAKIDPQIIKDKSLYGTILCDTEITGSFDGAYISRTDFTGSKGAKINPQTVFSMVSAKLCDTKIVGSFAGVDIRDTDFTGSKGAKIDPLTIFDRDLRKTNLCDVEVRINGPLDKVKTTGTKFTGCNLKMNFKRLSITDILGILNSVSDLENADSGQKGGFETSGVQKIKK